VPAAADEPGRLVEIPLLAGETGELDEGRLDAGMPADAVVSARAEGFTHVVGGPGRYLQKRPAADPGLATAAPSGV
jgi:hypothetical protein